MSKAIRLTAAAVLFIGLTGCGGSEPPKVTPEEQQRMMEQTKKMYEEKMGGMKTGMTPEDMARMKEKYAPKQ